MNAHRIVSAPDQNVSEEDTHAIEVKPITKQKLPIAEFTSLQGVDRADQGEAKLILKKMNDGLAIDEDETQRKQCRAK
jgi:hypothetical protein